MPVTGAIYPEVDIIYRPVQSRPQCQQTFFLHTICIRTSISLDGQTYPECMVHVIVDNLVILMFDLDLVTPASGAWCFATHFVSILVQIESLSSPYWDFKHTMHIDREARNLNKQATILQQHGKWNMFRHRVVLNITPFMNNLPNSVTYINHMHAWSILC